MQAVDMQWYAEVEAAQSGYKQGKAARQAAEKRNAELRAG